MDCQLLTVLFHQHNHARRGIQPQACQDRFDLVVALFAHQEWGICHRKTFPVGWFIESVAVSMWKDWVGAEIDKQVPTTRGFVGPHTAKSVCVWRLMNPRRSPRVTLPC